MSIFGLAAMMAVLSAAYSNLVAPDVIVPWLWPTIFAADACLLVAFGFMPTSQRLYSMAGPVMVVSLLSRPAAVMIDYSGGYVRSGWAIVVAVIVYGLLAMLLQRWWLDHVGSWRVRHETETQVKGD